MTSFQILFLIILYLNIKIGVANQRNGRDKSLANSKPVNYLYFSFYPTFSLIILGFLIMKWYIFIPAALLIMFDPLAILLGTRHAQSTMIFVFKNYMACIAFNIISTIGCWYFFFNQ